jgi:hypothetical protein
MPLISRGPLIPAAPVGSSATAGLMRFELHLATSGRHADPGTPVAIYGSLMAAPLAQRNAVAPTPQAGQVVRIRATWYVPGQGEVSETLCTLETDRSGTFGTAVLARDVPVDYTAVVDGPEGQPALATSEAQRVSPH